MRHSGNRQTTPRMDRHETIVAERCETFRYPAHGNACQVHLDEGLLHAALPAAIPLDDGCLEGHALSRGMWSVTSPEVVVRLRS